MAVKQLKAGFCFNAIEIHSIYFLDKRASHDALGIKTFRDFLHDIGMNFVQERVHTGCHMIPE